MVVTLTWDGRGYDAHILHGLVSIYATTSTIDLETLYSLRKSTWPGFEDDGS